MDRSTGDLQLIRLVRQHLYLYDTGSDNYKNVKLKDNTWKKIALALGLSVEVSKTRWKSLRTSYLRHCKLMACRRRESTKCRKWPLADELSFLNPYLVPTDCVAGSNGVEEPEPLSEDAWARVYEDAKPSAQTPSSQPPAQQQQQQQPMEGVADEEEEDDDDEIEEIIEHPPVEELREAFAASDAAEVARPRAGSAASEASYSSLITLVEPDSAASRGDRRCSRPSGGGNGAGGAGGCRNVNGPGGSPLRSSHPADDDPRRQHATRDTTRDFFLYLADTVKTFPPYLQAQIKGKCFEAVNSAELSLMTPIGRGGNATPKR